ncbi:jg24247 [Pararge aegeria aegeria]|uniref:Jg24247 protein n=1 Tax=Pararge aegeria aegeria TaxID=348720 RepID=A0A8S4QDQ9_9NEOP|nr:jg24247 [Pararge aegeria aegeria]
MQDVIIKSEDHANSRRKLAEPDCRSGKTHRKESMTASCSAVTVNGEEVEFKLKLQDDITFGCSLCHKEFPAEREYDEHMDIQSLGVTLVEGVRGVEGSADEEGVWAAAGRVESTRGRDAGTGRGGRDSPSKRST